MTRHGMARHGNVCQSPAGSGGYGGAGGTTGRDGVWRGERLTNTTRHWMPPCLSVFCTKRRSQTRGGRPSVATSPSEVTTETGGRQKGPAGRGGRRRGKRNELRSDTVAGRPASAPTHCCWGGQRAKRADPPQSTPYSDTRTNYRHPGVSCFRHTTLE